MTTPNLEGRTTRRFLMEDPDLQHTNPGTELTHQPSDYAGRHNHLARIATLEAEDSHNDMQQCLDAEAYARGLKPLVLADPDLTALTNAGLNLRDTTGDVPPPTRAGAAVDVGLLHDLGKALDPIDGLTYEDDGRELLASESMQRLRAAWTAEAEAEAESVRQAFDVVKLRADNASLRAQVDGRLRDNDVAAEALKTAWRERDEARAEVERMAAEALTAERHADETIQGLRAELDTARAGQAHAEQGWADSASAWCEVHAVVPRAGGALLRRTLSHIATLTAEVERLRAAVPDLPDVGPAERKAGDPVIVRVGGYVFDGTRSPAHHRMRAAHFLAVAAFLDREAEERAGPSAFPRT